MAHARHRPSKQTHKGEPLKVDLNRASREELMKIPGVGSYVAEQIIVHRAQPGEPEQPKSRSEHWHISEREFDDLVERLYI
ncbi:MAG TPA: helix-hairpin-helix domain-containing protein [Tepidisphaeraceae bacterium]|nr:helix-hairpin-helix domain-containing protein [Tepidisphaeraceae bacterium]